MAEIKVVTSPLKLSCGKKINLVMNFKHMEKQKHHIEIRNTKANVDLLNKALCKYANDLNNIGGCISKYESLNNADTALDFTLNSLLNLNNKHYSGTETKRRVLYKSVILNFEQAVRVLKKRNKKLKAKANKLIAKAKKLGTTKAKKQASRAIKDLKKSVKLTKQVKSAKGKFSKDFKKMN